MYHDPRPHSSCQEPSPKKVKSLYDSYVSARDREERGLGDREGGGGKTNKPRHTIYVFGYNVTEDILKNTFSANGKIVNVSMEVEKVRQTFDAKYCTRNATSIVVPQNCGFVTFDKSEAAEQAILDHNGTVVQGIALKVQLCYISSSTTCIIVCFFLTLYRSRWPGGSP